MSHSTDKALTEQREEWFLEVQEGILRHVGDTTALAKYRLRNDLGEPRLIASMLVARIAVQLARGGNTANIRDTLVASSLFTPPDPHPEELIELITKVQTSFGYGGLALTVDGLNSLGLPPWSPESAYMLLTEYWAAQRGSTIPRERVERELNELWDMEDSRVIAAHSSLPAFPLDGYPDLWASLKAEADVRVGNAVGMMLTQHGADKAWERWVSTRTWSILKVGHLERLGEDLARCQAARRALRRLLDQVSQDDDLHSVVVRAREIVDQHLQHIALAVEGMSAIECELLRERDEDEHFQDLCLTTFQQNPMTRNHEFCPSHEYMTRHGTWGPLPWWSIVVHGERERQAAANLLLRHGMQLYIAKSQDSDEVVITCQEPGLGPSGLAARLRFDLGNAVHACELLLLARRQSVAVDFLAQRTMEWGNHELSLIGTLNITLDGAISGTLANLATGALRRLVPGTSGPTIYPDGIPALDRLLRSRQLPDICRYPR